LGVAHRQPQHQAYHHSHHHHRPETPPVRRHTTSGRSTPPLLPTSAYQPVSPATVTAARAAAAAARQAARLRNSLGSVYPAPSRGSAGDVSGRPRSAADTRPQWVGPGGGTPVKATRTGLYPRSVPSSPTTVRVMHPGWRP
jgi:hypothetical protein